MSKQELIAVGVDGSAGSRTAIRWAAREADRLDVGLRLVHVFSDIVPMGSIYAEAYPLTPVESRLVAQELVDTAAKEAMKILPSDRVSTMVLKADIRAGLVQAAADARVLVLGDERHPALDRLITGSVVGSVAAHSPTPVVAVPENWQDATNRGVVVAGVKSVDAAAPFLRQAFRLAAEHQARLVVLHAWDYLGGYDDMIAARVDVPAWELHTHTELQDGVTRVAQEFPGVSTEVRVLHAQPAQALVDASADADLLVIARRPHGFPFGHLGGTGRAILRETRCPAVVLPPAAELIETTSPAADDQRQPTAMIAG